MNPENNILESRTLHMGIRVEPRAMKDDQGREFYLFEISNEEIDSHGTIFRMNGAKIDSFNEDPIVTYGHPWFDSTDPDDVIGIGPAYVENGKLMARFYPEMGDQNEKAVKVRSKLQQNIIKSASIVAYVEKYHEGRAKNGEPEGVLIFDEWELLMWGVVMKGSNPKAKKRTEEKIAEFRTLLSGEGPVNKIETSENNETSDIIVGQEDTRSRDMDMITLSEINLALTRSKLKSGDTVAKPII